MAKLTLDVLKDALKAEALSPELVNPSGKFPFPHLLVPLGKDFKNRNLELILWIDQEPIPCLQLIFLFPFNYTDETLTATARYLHMLNKSSAFPGFGLSEPDHALYFKYAFPFQEGPSLPSTMRSFIGLIEFLYDTYAQNIEEIASGNKSFIEIVAV